MDVGKFIIRKSKYVAWLLLISLTLYLLHTEIIYDEIVEDNLSTRNDKVVNDDADDDVTSQNTSSNITDTTFEMFYTREFQKVQTLGAKGYIIYPGEVCKKEKIEWIFYVHTSPGNVRKRAAIRKTWGNKTLLRNLKTQIFFVVGKVDDAKVMNEIQMESRRYGDILQADFIDSYRNLTLKALAALKWISLYCKSVEFVLKTDDDMVVDVVNLRQQFKNDVVPVWGNSNLLLCYLWKGAKVFRNKKSKWFISEKDYSEERYPSYCAGAAYIFSIDAVKKIYKTSTNTTFFWVDDVYITGILAVKSNIQQVPINKKFLINMRKDQAKILRNDDEKKYLIYNAAKIVKMYEFWNIVYKRNQVSDDYSTTIESTSRN